MVRRIGFGRKKKSAADQHMDRFRAETRADEKKDEVAQKTKRRGWPIIIFLCFWLVLWSGAVLAVAGILLSGSSDEPYFLAIWEFFAIAGWFMAVKALVKEIRAMARN